MTRTLEADIAQQIAQAARQNQKVKDHYQAETYSKSTKEAGLSTKGCQVTKPGRKLVEMVEVPSKNDPERNVLTSEQHVTTAKAQDFFRGRFAGKLETTPMRYGKDIPPMKGVKELHSHWATIEKPTHGRKCHIMQNEKQE
jgi:hypothetical protein